MLTRCDSTQVVYILEWICDDAFIRSYVWCIRIQVYMLKHIISDIFICLVFIINFVSSFPARVFGYVCKVTMTNTTHHRSFFSCTILALADSLANLLQKTISFNSIVSLLNHSSLKKKIEENIFRPNNNNNVWYRLTGVYSDSSWFPWWNWFVTLIKYIEFDWRKKEETTNAKPPWRKKKEERERKAEKEKINLVKYFHSP